MTCVRCEDEDKTKDDVLYCKEIGETSKAKELLDIADSYVTTNLLRWSNCVAVCRDGERCMSGIHEGLHASICRKSPCAVWTDCMIHRQALASKHNSPELDKVLE
jgi:hypothetical protein